MKTVKYIFFILGIIALEIILVYVLFYFAGASKDLYVIFSLAVIIAIAFYLIYGRYRERIKIKNRTWVLNKYKMLAVKIVIAIISITALSIVCTGAYLL